MSAARRLPHQRRQLGHNPMRIGCTIFISCTFLQRFAARGGAGNRRLTRQSGWHEHCMEWLDPPFGGLWCDQPAFFCLRPAARSAASCRFARARCCDWDSPRGPRERPGGRFMVRFRAPPR